MAMNKHITEELVEAVFSIQSMPRLYDTSAAAVQSVR
jgi:hypothetical protein